MKSTQTNIFTRYAIVFTWVYFTFLFGWLLAYCLKGDQIAYLALANTVAVVFFFPLPLAGVIVLITRRKEISAGTVLGLAVFLIFWGPLFLPRFDAPPKNSDNAKLRVMTYNTLGPQKFTEPAIEVIRSTDADVIFFQELNHGLAQELQTRLLEAYPYQLLDPDYGVVGMGTISCYPLELAAKTLPLNWVGTPQIMQLDWDGRTVSLLNFHAFSLSFYPPEQVNYNFRYREEQAQVLADFAAQNPGPVILAGDANTVPLSAAYKIIVSNGLQDAWQAAGFGLGHTFPGSDLPESHRPRIGPWYAPKWLARIDYVFVSPHWEVISAELAPFDGVSDHRGVVVDLILTP